MLGKKLNLGDTIGLICPASGDSHEKIDEAVYNLSALGFKIKKGKHIYDKHGYLAGEDYDRAEDLQNMFLDDSVDAILCYRGGYGTMRILPYLNLNKIKKHPKIFIGYSDITTLLNIFYSKLDLITFHGPMGCNELSGSTLDSLLSMTMNKRDKFDIFNPEGISLQFYGKGSAIGRIIGGNLSLISSLLGTPYEPDFKNKILFLEDVDESPYAIDRMLCHLSLSKKLSLCRGFILGQFKGCSKEGDINLNDIFSKYIFSLNKPVISNFMSGHDMPKLTIPIGAKIKIDVSKETLSVLEPVISQ